MNAHGSRSFPRIPGFEIEDRIGFGGFATVYRARQPGLDRTVAIKVVHRTRTADDETLRRFRRECQAIGSLTGTPAVMTVFDLGTTSDGDPYLVLEFLEGGSLQEQLEQDGRFAWTEVIAVARDLARALQAAHGLGILHRDIKPANVLRDRYGNVRLGDFGIAHLAGSSESTTGDTAMTVSYAAPEMLLGRRATPASDLYSLGALMYTLMNGRPPFSRPDDDSVAAVIRRITTDPVPPLPAGLAPPPLVEIIESLMSKERVFRPSAEVLIERLGELGDSARGAGTASAPARNPRPDVDLTRDRRSLPGKPPAMPGVPSTDGSGPRSAADHRAGDRKITFSNRTVNRSGSPSTPVPGPFSTGGTLASRHLMSGDRSSGLSGPLGHAVFDSGMRGRDVFGGLGYAVDIVFVIDITASMWPVLSQVKRHALGFHERLIGTMAAKGKHVSKLRVRIVAFRDYYDNPTDALFHTPFLELPAQRDAYDRYVAALAADGGGDEPESGLEALALAMASPWERGLDRRRHVVVLCTDASAHPLAAAAGRVLPGYPTNIPGDFDGLTDAWDDSGGRTVEYASKRLLLYAPDVYPWNLIAAHWDSVLHFPSKAGEGLSEVDFGQIVDAIAGSI